MGFVLFTASGTFKPSDYGLVTGDVLHVKVVGGGGGGAGASNGSLYAASNGSASSFGSILTAAGGLGGTTAAGTNTIVSGSNVGGPGHLATRSGIYLGSRYYCGSGSGGDGWYPGILGHCGMESTLLVPIIPGLVSASASSSSVTVSTTMVPLTIDGVSTLSSGRECTMLAGTGSSASMIGISTANALPNGHSGSAYVYSSASSSVAFSAGGLGYGAGGGGGIYIRSNSTTWYGGMGGSSGVIADTNYVLPNQNNIAITVGAGGAGYTSSYSGGGGAIGCVAIWW